MTEVYSEFQTRHLHMHLKMLANNQNLILFGPRGSGKTTYINRLLKMAQMPYIKVNCLMGDRKSTFLKILCLQFRKLLNLEKLPFFNNFEALLRALNQMYKSQRSLFERIEQNDGMYCWIDNIQELKVTQRFLSTLLSFAGHDNIAFKINFILSGIGFNNHVTSLEQPICEILLFYHPHADKLFLETIVKNHLKGLYEEEFEKKQLVNFEHFVTQLVKIVIEGLIMINRDLNNAKKIAELIYEKTLEIHLEEKIGIYKITAGNYFREYFNKVIQFGPALENLELQRKVAVQNKIVEESNDKSCFYPDLIETAIYFAENCSENDDMRRFKDYRKGSKRALEMKKLTVKNKKHNILRVLSIAESLQNQGKQNNKEYSLENHSLDFFSCIQYLRQQEKIKFIGKSGAFGLGKIQGRPDEAEVISFLKRNDLKYEQYL